MRASAESAPPPSVSMKGATSRKRRLGTEEIAYIS
jgi:hypothetical protein